MVYDGLWSRDGIVDQPKAFIEQSLLVGDFNRSEKNHDDMKQVMLTLENLSSTHFQLKKYLAFRFKLGKNMNNGTDYPSAQCQNYPSF